MEKCREIARQIRVDSVYMTNKAQSGHVGSMLSMADMIAVLYEKILKVDPKNPDMPDRDAFVIDPAGCGLAPLRGRAISDEDATPKGFDGVKRMALGELTFLFKNAKQRICRISGLTSSSDALAAIKG